MPTKCLTKQLKYTVPRIRICLVHEDLEPDKLLSVNCPEDIGQFLAPLQNAAEEYFISLQLNVKNEVIGLHEVSHGTLSASLVHPREVFKAAILSNSHAIIIGHNHPSLSHVCPSQEDLTITRQLIEAGKLLGISVLDHVIVSPNQDVYSLRENYPELWDA